MIDSGIYNHPQRLLRLFAVLVFVSAILILLLVGLGAYHIIYERQILHDAEERSVDSAKAIFALQKDRLMNTAGGVSRIYIRGADLASLDESMRLFFAPFGVYKIKLYSADRRVAYSTDRDIIGQADNNNETLERALRGEIVSKRYRKDRVTDLKGEQRFGVEVVGTYLPVQDDAKRVIGSFEVYTDLSHYQREIANVLWPTLLTLLTVLALVFSPLYLLMRQGVRRVVDIQGELHRLAVTDGLTGLFNRRYLMSRANEEFAKLIRQNKGHRNENGEPDTVGVIMLDIDHFKQVNDKSGHCAGDEVLKQVSARLRETVRAYDIVGRYGGEEFLLILPLTDLKGAMSLAERIMTIIRDQPCRTGDESLSVTVSIGVTCSDGRGESVDRAIKRADMALYQAKQNGRNRIAFEGLPAAEKN